MQFLKLFAPILIAIFLIFSDYKFSYLDNFKQLITKLTSPVYLLVNLPSQLYLWVNEQGADRQFLLNQNKRLNAELIRLKVKLQRHNALLSDNQKLSKLLKSRYQIDKGVFVLARVSTINQSRLKKQIVINKGSRDDIKVGQIALGADGVLGQVSQVTPFYATILLITDPTQHIPVKNQRNGIRGVGKGIASNQDKLMVRFIESGLDIKVGDVFLTSAIVSKFPAGYPVGRVTRVENRANDPFLYVELAPAQTTQQLEFILINTRDN
ncbi:Rod shape-determining protein MreC [Bathymodiolus thermophilus thioautotrophic gill symbiont]|jgi:rod shape-determining protein MreC|uniref:Cell shape-determining protein MreC n=1 Tax=Bathymodiolus thermophilus thioautotrophic gill symbiont TaxID=2360 RepID=A0A1J5UD22_9GAMM|nr:rod shape-determining protein MreC [Bathymodiolus thermophilus thioautotrophic gill symbiont]AYQ56230.1 Rod shape-determining protein MreC [Bathymodiolus thermophilus thioautotrophic gill symbiont]OIR23829.1 rod shape-determining protein MreC [Bathymodiolus thermophilus thioautotrophic gill symbiont]CAB5501317.1 Rod shape-determining protein MreC [Bathymodiolus thermophilus thioautotrophic gill symbiont]CAB5505751.1 Rod shape-determining protein MreC [Bathymodiolus thermophilus thioautotroph